MDKKKIWKIKIRMRTTTITIHLFVLVHYTITTHYTEIIITFDEYRPPEITIRARRVR
jgi:hypothetical protein